MIDDEPVGGRERRTKRRTERIPEHCWPLLAIDGC